MMNIVFATGTRLLGIYESEKRDDERKLWWRMDERGMDGRRMDNDHWSACLSCDHWSRCLARDAFAEEQTTDLSLISPTATPSFSNEWARI
jgi:hypothetical protein